MTGGVKINYVPWLKSDVLDMRPIKENVINHIQYKILISKWHVCIFYRKGS